jgi:uncharacterized protein
MMKGLFTKILLAMTAAMTLSFSVGHAAYVKPRIEHAKFGNLKGVIPLSTNDERTVHLKLMNMLNMLVAAKQWGGKLDLSMVLYSEGLLLLSNPSNEVKKSIDALRAHNVRFLVCNNSLMGLEIDYRQLYGVNESDIVPSGSLEVIYLQQCCDYYVDPLN